MNSAAPDREVLRTLIGMVPMLRTVGRCLVVIGEALEQALPAIAAHTAVEALEAAAAPARGATPPEPASAALGATSEA